LKGCEEMSNLDNLTSKILNDAKIKADEIVKAAQKTAAEKYKKEIGKYNSQKASLEESAVRDRDLAVERIKSGASLKIRNEKLKAKQQVIDKVIRFSLCRCYISTESSKVIVTNAITCVSLLSGYWTNPAHTLGHFNYCIVRTTSTTDTS